MECLEGINRLLEHLHHGDAAHVLGARLVHLDERLHVLRHEVHTAPAHHVEHAAKREDDRNQARKPESPVEREEQREHADDHGDRSRRVGQLMREQPFRLRRAAVNHAPQRARGVRVEVAERRAHQMLGRLFAHVRRAAERRQVRAHESREVQQDGRRRKAERPPPVGSDARGRAPVGRDRDEVASHKPDAHIRAEPHDHRERREHATQIRERLARPGEVKQPRDGTALARGRIPSLFHGNLRSSQPHRLAPQGRNRALDSYI